MGIGDWGLGIGDWGLGPIPNFFNIFINYYQIFKIKNKNNYNINIILILLLNIF